MILIFGGAYQGKLAYTLERFGLTEQDVFRCSDENIQMPENKKVIYEIDKWILALIKRDEIEAGTLPVEKAIQQFIETAGQSPCIVICNDISCGIVPIDPVLRKWRETVGRSLSALSRISDEVIRLFCGIPTGIK